MIKRLLEKIIVFSIFLIIFVSVSILAFLFTFNEVWNLISTPTISVPQLVGLSLKDAVRITGRLNLILKIEKEVQSDTHPDGYIISQEPKAGTKIREENPIEVVIVTRSLSKKVPNLIGYSVYDAEEKLSEAGMNLIRKAYVYDDIVDKDVVISQSPSPGDILGTSEGVSLLISKGKRPYKMPSLYGLDLEEGEYIVHLLGLEVKGIKKFNIEDMPDGQIIYQSIEAGKEVKKGDFIVIGIAENGNFKTGSYSTKVSFEFAVPPEREKFRVKIVKRDDTGDRILIDKELAGGEVVKYKVEVNGITKLYISLDGILYEVRRIN